MFFFYRQPGLSPYWDHVSRIHRDEAVDERLDVVTEARIERPRTIDED